MVAEHSAGNLKELFSDNTGKLSSFRVMAMMGMATGCVVLLIQSLGISDTDLNTPLTLLFTAALGGKAGQKFAEEK